MIRFRAPIAALSIASVTALALASALTPAVAAAKAPTRDQAAAGWLARQFTGRSHLVSVFGGKTFANQGGTIDAIFAFAATGAAQDFGQRAIAWLAQPKILSGYIGDGKASSFAGATAKAALAAEVQGMNPRKFGGVDLFARLAKLLTKSGRYSDHSSFGDFSNAFTQSLAILALSRHGNAPKSAVNFLVSSQCKDGGFPLNFGAEEMRQRPGLDRHGYPGPSGRRPQGARAARPALAGASAASQRRIRLRRQGGTERQQHRPGR